MLSGEAILDVLCERAFNIELLDMYKVETKVGEVVRVAGRGIYFAYDQGWLTTGYNLSPLTMPWDDICQLYKASIQVQEGKISTVFTSLRLAGSSPGGARPYDLTFPNIMGEHTTDFGGRTPGKPTRKRIMEICKDYKYLKAKEYIEQTLVALAEWEKVFIRLNVPHKAGESIFNGLMKLHQDFEK